MVMLIFVIAVLRKDRRIFVKIKYAIFIATSELSNLKLKEELCVSVSLH